MAEGAARLARRALLTAIGAAARLPGWTARSGSGRRDRGSARARGTSSGRPRPRLLVIRPDHLGDVLLATAALAALRERAPDAEIVALVGPWSSELLARNPDVDRVLTFPFPWFDRRPAGIADRYLSALRLAERLRGEQFDRGYVLRPDHWWGAMALALAGVPERIGYGTPENRPFLTRAYPVPSEPEHAVRSMLRLIEGDEAARRARPGEPPTRFCTSSEDRARAAARLSQLGLAKDAPFVLAHPGASTPVKRWPAERWAAVVDQVASAGDGVLLVGGPGEASVLAAIAERARRPPRLLGDTPTIGELAALLARARLAVGMDSAPMHLATAVGTPTLRLAGPADERLFGPWGDPARHRVVRAPGTRPDDAWFGAAGATHPTLLALDVPTVLAELARLREAVA